MQKENKSGGMMERLTVDYGKQFSTFRYAMKDGSDAEIGYFKNYDAFYSHMLMVQKLGEYEDLEEQGLLLRFPCKVGNTIYVNGILGVGEAEEYKVIRVDYHSNLAMKRSEFYIEALLASAPENSIGFYDKEIGKTVFLTKAEAEQKLKEMENE